MLQWVVVNGYVNLWVKTFPINFVTYKNWFKDTRQNLRFGEDIWKNRGIKKSVDMGSIRLPFRDRISFHIIQKNSLDIILVKITVLNYLLKNNGNRL